MNMEFYLGNRSYRKFTQEKISEADMQYILEALRLSHCGNNKQTLRYVVVNSGTNVQMIGEQVHYAALLPKEVGTPKPDEQATAYIVICKPVSSGPIADVDAGIAAERVTCAAWDHNIGSCMIMNFKQDTVKELLGIDEAYVPRIIVALGYPKIQSIVEEVKDQDLKYYVDDKGNYHVPKLSLDELVEYK